MKVILPKKTNIKETGAADPLKFYYLPIVRSFYLSRFSDAIRLLGGERIDRLLEVGCGSGIFLCELAKHCSRLFACDIHSHLDLVTKMLQDESVNATLVKSSAYSLPFAAESMDAIVCMSVLEHISCLESSAEEFFRVLKSGGFAVVGVPVTNLMTDTMLRIGYLSLDARLEDEHISTHNDVIDSFSKKFLIEKVYSIPRFLPGQLCMYKSIRFRKSGKR